MAEKLHADVAELGLPVSRWTVLSLLVAVVLAVLLTRHADPYFSVLYAEGGGLENAFFALIFLLFPVIWFAELKLRGVKKPGASAGAVFIVLAGAALCMRYGQQGLMVWLVAEICITAAARSYQRRSLKSGTPQ